MNYTALKTELAYSRYDGMTDALAAADLNDKRLTRIKPLTTHELRIWAAQSGRADRIRQAANDEGKTQETRSIAQVATAMLSTDNGAFDLNDDKQAEMIQALIAAEVLDVNYGAAMTTQATEPLSRSGQLGLGVVCIADIEDARRS
jgi:hypothetical protein